MSIEDYLGVLQALRTVVLPRPVTLIAAAGDRWLA
jgi:hypothetical protein